MKTITLHEVSDSLLRKLEARAAANRRSLEEEALSCLQVAVAEEEWIGAIDPGQWSEIEQSVCETIHDQGTPLTAADFERYRGLARGDNRS